MGYHSNLWIDATPADIRDRNASERARKEKPVPDLSTMTDEALATYVHDLRVLNYNASQMRNARSFGRTQRELERAWREQDRRNA